MSYQPTHPGVEITIEWLYSELLRVAIGAEQLTTMVLSILNTEPAKPQEGMVVYADGVGWDPGSGEGLYVYSSGVWVFLQTTVSGSMAGLASQLPSNGYYPLDEFDAPSWASGLGITAGSMNMWPVFFDSDATFDGLEVNVSALHATAVVDFHLYEFLGNGLPGAAVVAVNVPVTATGIVTVGFSATAIQAGWYFASIHQSGAGAPGFWGVNTNTAAGNIKQPAMLVSDPWGLLATATESMSRRIADANLVGGSYTFGNSLAGTTMTTANTTGDSRVPTILFIKA